jgi:class 3 adenylate cyclase
MGPHSPAIVSSLGDNVSIAARLEAQTKGLSVSLIILTTVAVGSGIDMGRIGLHSIQVKGRDRAVGIYTINDPLALSQ